MELASDAKIWVANPTVDGDWLKAEVVSRNGDEVVAKTEDGTEHKLNAQDLKFQNDLPDAGVPDMTKLNYLHEPGLLNNLRRRFAADHVYTYTGKICIAINPFNWAVSDPLYTPEILKSYHKQEFGERPPHIYAIAEEAYTKIRAGKDTPGGGDQSILVSGESGAGKTESVKIMMQFLAVVSVSGKNEVTDQVLESNPLLEAFGNARTLRNNNSSRFGKFIELQFNSKCSMSGAKIHVYLLEKTRVIGQLEGERNYHIFYQMLKGVSAEQKAELKLGTAKDYIFTSCSSCVEIEGLDDALHFGKTMKAMSVIGVSNDDIQALLRLLSSVLHLSNLTFQQTNDDAAFVEEGASIDCLALVAGLLHLNPEEMPKALTQRQVCARDDWFTVNLTKDQAAEGRDALVKTIYGRIFVWLVEVLNITICHEDDQESFIGILDIFGFEHFKVNSFEQLCINYANERLQQQFNWDIFKSEQAEYEQEKIEWKYIEFKDNQPCLDLIDKRPMGLLHILNEESSMQQGTDETFVKKLVDQYRKHENFKVPRLAKNAFTVKHYAGEVTYEGDGFREKNKDSLHPDLTILMQSSSNSFISALFPEALFPSQQTPKATPGRGGKRGGSQTVGSQFQSQLQSLMSTINATGVNYVRCIKPNTQNKPAIFQTEHSAMQLRCAGVLEAIRISRLAYPNRLLHREFVRRYSVIADKPWQKANEAAVTASCQADLDAAGAEKVKATCNDLLTLTIKGEESYQVGVTKVFFKAFVLEKLEEARAEYLATAVVTLQKNVRMLVHSTRFHLMRNAAKIIQASSRSHACSKEFRKARKAAITLEAGARGMQSRKHYKQLMAVLKLQCSWRCHIARAKVTEVRRNTRATTIQSRQRSVVLRSRFKTMRRAAVKLQTYQRMRAAQAEFKVQMAEKKEEAKLSNQLEKLRAQLDGQIKARQEAEAEKEKLQKEMSERTAGGATTGPAPTDGTGSVLPPDNSLVDKLKAGATNWLFKQGGDTSLEAASEMLGTLTTDRDVLHKRLKEQTNLKEKADSLSKALEKELSTLKNKYTLEARTRQKLEEKHSQMDQEMDELRKHINDQAHQIIELSSERDTLKKKFTELDTKNNAYEDNFYDLEARNLRNTMKMEEYKKAKGRAEEEMNMYKAMLQASHERGLKERQEIRRDALKKIESLQQELVLYKEEIHLAKQKLYEKEEDLKKRLRLEEEMGMYKEMLGEERMQRVRLEEKLQQSRASMDAEPTQEELEATLNPSPNAARHSLTPRSILDKLGALSGQK